jgi:hypothetical protein
MMDNEDVQMVSLKYEALLHNRFKAHNVGTARNTKSDNRSPEKR